MLKLGLVRLLAVGLLGFVIPLGAYWLKRRIGTPLILLLAAAIGLCYGAVKADNPWSGDGLNANLLLMATSALIVLVYAALAVGAATVVAKAATTLRR